MFVKDMISCSPHSANVRQRESVSQVTQGSNFPFYVWELQGELFVYPVLLRFVNEKKKAICRDAFQEVNYFHTRIY